MAIRHLETVHTAGPAHVDRVEVRWESPTGVEISNRYEYACDECDGFYGHVGILDRERACDDVDAHALEHRS